MGEILKHRLKQSNFDSTEMELILNIFVAANFLRSKNEALLCKFGLTMPQYNVLRILKGKYPEGYPRCDIIDRMIEPAPDVTRLIDRLIKDGLVERYNSAEDRRLSLARITKKGISLLSKINPEIMNLHSDFASVLTRSEMETLSELLEKLYESEVKA